MEAEILEWIADYEAEERRQLNERHDDGEDDMKWKDSGGGDYEQPPVGTHVARCVKLIDIGTQKGEYQGKATMKRQVIIGFELPNELMTEGEAAGKPFTVSKFYTASLGEKANLRKDLANWRGRDFTVGELQGFDSKNILGKACMLSLTANEAGKTRITGVMALPKGTQVPPQVNPTVYLSLERDEFNREVFEALSDGYKKFITNSPEYQELLRPAPKQDDAGNGGGRAFDDMEDEIPF